MSPTECYSVLGVPFGAEETEVRDAYRRLALQWHPDRFTLDPDKHAQADEMMRRINAAYEMALTRPSAPRTWESTDYDGGDTRPSPFANTYYWSDPDDKPIVNVRGRIDESRSDARVMTVLFLLVGLAVLIVLGYVVDRISSIRVPDTAAVSENR